MKTTIQSLIAALFVAVSLQTHAQGTLIIDQQATTNPPAFTGDYFYIQKDSPLLQSFMPTFSAIGFVQFQFQDPFNQSTNGATVDVELWEGSPDTNSATLLGSTTPVYMPEGFGFPSGFGSSPGVTNFYFSTPITLIAGDAYYLEPVVLSGDNPYEIKNAGNTYSNGELFSNGVNLTTDLWFTEGVVAVPEPSTLALVGLAALFIFTRSSITLRPQDHAGEFSML